MADEAPIHRPPRAALLPTFLAWTFGLGWGLTLFARLMAGPADRLSEATLLGVTWLPGLIWFIVVFGVTLMPLVVGLKLARRWGIATREWGWSDPKLRVLWGLAAGGALVLVAYVAALITRPPGFDPLWLAPWRTRYWQINAGNPVFIMALTLVFCGPVLTEAARYGLRRSMLLAAAAAVVWPAGIFFMAGGVRAEFAADAGVVAPWAFVFSVALSVLGWMVVSGWLRIRTGSAWTAVLMFWLWEVVRSMEHSPLNPNADDSIPTVVYAVVGTAIVIAAAAALLRPPHSDRWEPPGTSPHRAEDVLQARRVIRDG